MRDLDDFIADAREKLDRVEPHELDALIAEGVLVVDHRDFADRAREGVIPGSVYIPRSVLEWRLAPTSDWRSHNLGPDDRIVLVCNDGCSSSLAAFNLQQLGLLAATDLIGGYRGWLSRGRSTPTSPPAPALLPPS